MAGMRCVLAGLAMALLVGCTTSEQLESSRGIAVRLSDNIDALQAAKERADDHCDRHDRHAVLQSVSRLDDDEVLASFDCAGSIGGGVALLVDDDDADLGEAMREAEDYREDFDRIAVLQSVGEIDRRRVAAFNCVRA